MLLSDALVAVDTFHHSEPGVLFFCTHAHGDHLTGLCASWNKGLVYCSSVTARLLELRWPALGSRLRTLELGEVHRLSLGGDEGLPLDVLVVDAYHVPGAVMFIFTGFFGTVLYTGDFRLHPDHAHMAALPLLRDGLTRIYVDNTFCHPRFEYDTREVSEAAILKSAAAHWPCILFVAIYSLGKERLLCELARHLGARVLLSPERAAAFAATGVACEMISVQPCAPEEADAETFWKHGALGCIWAVGRRQLQTAVAQASSSGVAAHAIAPTGWAATRSGKVSGEGVESVAYSDHCSFLELVQFLSWLPAAPVVFISPVPTADGPFAYDGLEGVSELLRHAGVPSVSFDAPDADQQRQAISRKRKQASVGALPTKRASNSPSQQRAGRVAKPAVARRIPPALAPCGRSRAAEEAAGAAVVAADTAVLSPTALSRPVCFGLQMARGRLSSSS